MILADRDLSTGWVSSADAAEKRYYYLQNWRADTCAIVNDAGMVVRNFRYSAYGSRTEVSTLDYNRDGIYDFFDYLDFVDALGVPEARADINRDGAADSLDYSDFVDLQSLNDVDNTGGKTRNLYAGYENDPSLEKTAASSGGDSALVAWESLYHVRNRVYSTELGRWTRRDPLGYHDEETLYSYCVSSPVTGVDSQGLFSIWLPHVLRHRRRVLELSTACKFWVQQDDFWQPGGLGHRVICFPSSSGIPECLGFTPLGFPFWAYWISPYSLDPSCKSSDTTQGPDSTWEIFISPESERTILYGPGSASKVPRTIRHGPSKGKNCSNATCADIAACIKAGANGSGPYCPGVSDCRTSVDDLLENCCATKGKEKRTGIRPPPSPYPLPPEQQWPDELPIGFPDI